MKYLFLSLCMVSASFLTEAQSFHFNIYGGMTNYQGDLQDKRFTLNGGHLAGGVGLSYDLTDHFSIRTLFMLGKVGANDKDGRNKVRNLNFTTGLAEGSLDLQYFITPLGAHSLTPYLFGGVALFHYNPYTHDITGKKYYLKPLSTEGEGFVEGRSNYNLTQLAIPVGGGVKLSLSENVNVGFELGFRKLFTDYLDDVSTTYVDPNLLLTNRGAKALELSYRGDEVKDGSLVYPVGKIRGAPDNKDWYYFTAVTLSFRLGGGGLGRNSYYRCPGNVL